MGICVCLNKYIYMYIYKHVVYMYIDIFQSFLMHVGHALNYHP